MSAQSNWGNVPNWAYESVRALLESLKAVDPMTYEHCLRVGEYSRKLTRDMGLNEYQQKVAEFSGMLHDLGKIGIDKEILFKPGRLEPIEYDIMKSHAIISETIIRPLATHPFFAQVVPAVRGHHERMDGEGYPDKKMGEEIPLISRIILTVDTFDAMGEDRPYRKGLPEDIIFAELKRCSGTQFDSSIVKVFLEAQPHWKQDQEKETYNNIIKKIA
jgi:HD-GYP domain-containing protein (c-di-GMP phosphodiesterase class II)